MAYTPGPWYWTNRRDGRIYLYTPKNGHCVVMDFVRQGMQGAQPRFSDRGDQPLGGIMHNADELDLDNHPDARLIAAAPELLEACKALVDYRDHNGLNFQLEKADDFIHLMRIAIAKAEGQQP